MAKAFAFQLGQRVKVPGYSGCQAVIISTVADVIKGNGYLLRYLNVSGNTAEVGTTEEELAAANQPAYGDYRDLKFPSDDMADAERAEWLRTQATALREAAKPWDRLARIAKPASKSKKKK